MDAETILQRSDNTTFQTVADEAVLIHMDTGTYFSLNKVGTEFWEKLDAKKSIQKHAIDLAAQYEVEPEMVAADLLELAERLVNEKLADIV